MFSQLSDVSCFSGCEGGGLLALPLEKVHVRMFPVSLVTCVSLSDSRGLRRREESLSTTTV